MVGGGFLGGGGGVYFFFWGGGGVFGGGVVGGWWCGFFFFLGNGGGGEGGGGVWGWGFVWWEVLSVGGWGVLSWWVGFWGGGRCFSFLGFFPWPFCGFVGLFFARGVSDRFLLWGGFWVVSFGEGAFSMKGTD